MSRDQFNRKHLTEGQYLRLVDVVRESDNASSRTEFQERVLQILEDIPGLELISDSEANHIINKLWSLYHDQHQ